MRKKLLKNLDWGVLICAVILIAIGLTALFSTSQNTDHVEFIKQVQWLFISIPFFILAIVIDYDKILRIAPVFYGICVFLLILVLFTEQINGASSWFNIGSFSFQPSEFGKIATILFMAYALNLLQGNQTQLGYLHPKTTDFIFSAIGEEMGFLIAATIIITYVVLITRIVYIAKTAKDNVGSYIAIGIAGILCFHMVENIGMTMGLLPITGVPLPLVSYGGSSLLTNFVCLGLVVNVSARRQRAIFIE